MARHSKATKERHLHGSVALGIAAVGMAMLPVFLTRDPRIAFVALIVAMAGIWSVHGPLMGWPAAFLQGRAAASGMPKSSFPVYVYIYESLRQPVLLRFGDMRLQMLYASVAAVITHVFVNLYRDRSWAEMG